MVGLAPDTVQRLRVYFEDRSDVLLALVFGSRSKGVANARSDTDLGVYFRPFDETVEYQSDSRYPAEEVVWQSAEKICGTEVDLVVLNRATPPILSAALRGERLLVRDWGLHIDLLLSSMAESEESREKLFSEFLREQRSGG